MSTSPKEKDELTEIVRAISGEDAEPSKTLDLTKYRHLYGQDIGKILLQSASLKPEHLAEALAIKQEQGGDEDTLIETLLKKKWTTEAQILQALAIQLNVPLGDLKNLRADLDTSLVAKIPINFAKRFILVPIEKKGRNYTVAISSRKALSAIDDLKILLKSDIKAVLAPKSEIIDAINRVYNQATRANENLNQDLMEDLEAQNLENMNLIETQDLLESEDEAPIIRLVNALLFQAVKDRASDIHIEPGEKDLSVRLRIDGVLFEVMKPPKKAQNSISSRIKIMAQLDIAEKRIPQDGRIRIRIGGRDVDIRVSTLPTTYGERIVMRLLDTSNVVLDIKDLGFDATQQEHIKKIINLNHGIFLVTGPTGSGKTTTLYACISRINSRELNIITVEDPVEIQLAGIGQIQVNQKVNLTFASGLRSILRQDPDVIMVGEIRDLETAEIAIQASLTGHLVFSTLHTNDAPSTVTRLIDMGVEPFLVSSSLVAVMAQRLARRVCKDCREPYKPTPQELTEIGITTEQAQRVVIYRAKGCSTCSQTGYRGRLGIYELMPIDETLRGLILKAADGNTIKKAAVELGMLTLRQDGANKVLEGATTIEEVLRITQEELGFD
ncbi:MAG: type II secretion system ATPase GspE [Bdellovibrionales bacterium]|nr:type II secretion system ATPase GspE [Bdellovibrionales bacterium]